VNALPSAGVVQVSLVPFTREHTTLGTLARGNRVHVEADVLGKYVSSYVVRSGRTAIADIRAGKLVIVADDERRENEGDLIGAARRSAPR